ncbi:3'-5' exonuclease [Sphingobium vermicomposti]|uniref:DNA polymerase-3 subunit epsilon n=1 Tax=Sphingobium vermicomposti TaxID=529005 RepID=A0A846M3C8_9SPHN|nr:3'-5' exonuclease [Sphingobium vermicomposti]NIJ15061.1 DNA polymerase-3 subunit epsilon [Sphingobium vermicomposti]
MTIYNPAGESTGSQPSRQDTGDWDIRILRKVGDLADIPVGDAPHGEIRRVAVIDTETTGTDPLHDEIIDLAYVVLLVDGRGEIVGIEREAQALRDPGMPIPERISRLTGLTDAHVAGLTFDLDKVQGVLSDVDVCVAHNCQFDAAFLRHLLPATAEIAWACSARDFDWLVDAGLDGRSLGHLLMQIGFFSEAHRAMADVIALIHLLAHRLSDGGTVMGRLLANAERETVRVEATGAPFEKRFELKARGYGWDAQAKVWWIELQPDQVEAERLWLGRAVTPWGPSPRARAITWRQRHR